MPTPRFKEKYGVTPPNFGVIVRSLLVLGGLALVISAFYMYLQQLRFKWFT